MKVEAPPLQIPDWVPEAAWQSIKETWELPFLDENHRKALTRLVRDTKMKTVWKKLQRRDPDGVAGSRIIPSAIYALEIFPLLRPKPRSRKARQKWEQDWQRWDQYGLKHWVKHPHPTLGYGWLDLARRASDLRDALARLRYVLGPDKADEALARHLRRGPVFKDARYEADYARAPAMNTMGAAIGSLHSLYHGFLSIDEEHRSDLKRLPAVARWDHPKTPRLFFIDSMSDTIMKLYGQPYDSVVHMLTALAFNYAGPGSRAVQERRRMRGFDGHGLSRLAGKPSKIGLTSAKEGTPEGENARSQVD